MTEITRSYEILPRTGEPRKLVILLHGLGSNGQDLVSLAPYWAPAVPSAVFVSPDAPFPCDMVPPGYPNSYQWFSLQSRDPQDMLEGVRMAAPVLDAFIAQQCEKYGLLASDCALVGFSQGTMMSLHVGPRHKEKLAGVLGYSGALLWDGKNSGENLHQIPVHLIHGEADDVVPVEAYEAAKEILEKQGFTVTGHTTPRLAHSIDGPGIESGAAFLKSVLS